MEVERRSGGPKKYLLEKGEVCLITWFGSDQMQWPLLSKRHMRARLEFAERHLPIGLSNYEKQNAKGVVKQRLNSLAWMPNISCRKPGTNNYLAKITPTVKHGGGSIMLWGCFSAAGKMNAPMYFMLTCPRALWILRLEQRFIFQHNDDPNHTRIQRSVLEWSSQSPDLWLSENGCTSMLPIQPDWAWEVLQRTMGRSAQKSACQAYSIILRNTWSCNCCQKYFDKVLSKGCEYLYTSILK